MFPRIGHVRRVLFLARKHEYDFHGCDVTLAREAIVTDEISVDPISGTIVKVFNKVSTTLIPPHTSLC